ncbi:unknown [Prevotella sp. CAG:755]|nr:unknown [Prevotella sp. CAG:755]
MFMLPSAMAFHAAGGTITSDGKGIKELSMIMKNVTTQ